MRPIKDIQELRNIQLAILDNVHQFCEQHQLRYFLSSGTLIGAVRHKGYIPWDDDIDIYMPRADYERLLQSYQDPQGIFKAIDPSREEGENLQAQTSALQNTALQDFQAKPVVFTPGLPLLSLAAHQPFHHQQDDSRTDRQKGAYCHRVQYDRGWPQSQWLLPCHRHRHFCGYRI